MYLLFIFSLVTSSVTSERISFKNVTVEWKFESNAPVITTSTFNSLKENVPEVTTPAGPLSVTIVGSVPTLYKDSVSGLHSLKSLTLSNVELEEIEAEAFEDLPQLTYLILSHNKLSQIKKDTFTNLNLSRLDLGSNSISNLEVGAFKNLQIQHMSLSDNRITEIPSGLFENVTMTSLIMYNSALKRIEPGSFSSISGLVSLTLPKNNLEEIDPEAFNLPEMRFLDLSFNHIKVLRPGDLKNLPKLGTLQLVENKLTEIPGGVFNSTKVSSLKLNYNQISSISSDAFDDMSDLSVLHIDHNNLTLWDNNWLHNAPLPYLYLFAGFNQFEEVPDEAFKNYPKMYSIDLQANKIKRVRSRAFAKLENVVNFSLRDNEIENWDAGLLGDAQVGTIDLSGNKMKCIEGDLKEIFKNVDFLELYGNPWDEECGRRIEEYVREKEAETRSRSKKL